jgi:hypothetical protein
MVGNHTVLNHQSLGTIANMWLTQSRCIIDMDNRDVDSYHWCMYINMLCQIMYGWKRSSKDNRRAPTCLFCYKHYSMHTRDIHDVPEWRELLSRKRQCRLDIKKWSHGILYSGPGYWTSWSSDTWYKSVLEAMIFYLFRNYKKWINFTKLEL